MPDPRYLRPGTAARSLDYTERDGDDPRPLSSPSASSRHTARDVHRTSRPLSQPRTRPSSALMSSDEEGYLPRASRHPRGVDADSDADYDRQRGPPRRFGGYRGNGVVTTRRLSDTGGFGVSAGAARSESPRPERYTRSSAPSVQVDVPSSPTKSQVPCASVFQVHCTHLNRDGHH